MKFTTVLFKVPAALFVGAIVLTLVGPPQKVQAGPHVGFRAPGCGTVMPSTPALAQRIFGPYEWSGGGGSNLPGTGALRNLVPPGGYDTNCIFARKYDTAKQSIPTDSDILASGYVQLSNSAAVMQTWSRRRRDMECCK